MLSVRIESLRTLAEKATPEWKTQENGAGTVFHEYEIRTPTGGKLFRSTSYGNMEADAEFISAANPAQILHLIRLLEDCKDVLESARVVMRNEYGIDVDLIEQMLARLDGEMGDGNS